MNANLYFLLGCIIVIKACSFRQESSNACCSPIKVDANGYTVPRSSSTKPEIVPAGEPVIRSAQMSRKLRAHSNGFESVSSILISTPIPKIFMPGQDSITSPPTNNCIFNPVPCGAPTITTYTRPQEKEHTPENFNPFGKLQGLPDEEILSVAEDQQHRIWFGTRGGGVVLFNGKSYFRFTEKEGLGNQDVYAILEDKEGNMWFGTNSGVSFFNGKQFTQFGKKQGFVNYAVKAIMQDQDMNLWFAPESGGVIKYTPSSHYPIRSKRSVNPKEIQQTQATFSFYKKEQGFTNTNVNSMLADKKGNLWFATDGGGLIKYGPTGSGNEVTERTVPFGFVHYTETEGLENDYISSVVEDRHGHIWFGNYSGTLIRFDGKSFFSFHGKKVPVYKHINSILVDKSGSLWLGTDGAGIFKYEPNEKRPGYYQVTHYLTRQGLPDNSLQLYFQDRRGQIWYGIGNGQLGYYDPGFQMITLDSLDNKLFKEDLKNKNISCLLHDRQGNHWIGTKGAGLIRYDGVHFTQFTVNEGLNSNRITSLAEDRKGQIWIGSRDKGVSRYDGKEFTHFTKVHGLSSDTITCMMEDINGNLWFGTSEAGAIKYDGESILSGLRSAALSRPATFTYYTTKEGLSSNEITCMLEDKQGQLWFGTRHGGVSRYDAQNFPDGKAGFTRFAATEGLNGNEVYTLLEDLDGNIWLSNWGGGVSKYTPSIEGSGGAVFTRFTNKEGLNNNFVHSMSIDKAGHLWFGTSEGLCRMVKPGAINLNPASRHLDLFDVPLPGQVLLHDTYENGFWEQGSNINFIQTDENDFIWIASGDKIAIIQPAARTRDSLEPRIQLSGLTLFNEKINWSDFKGNRDTSSILASGVNLHEFYFDGISDWYNVPVNLSLAYNNNYLTFQYQAVTPGSAGKVKYQYKLAGLEKNWSDWTYREETPFVNLPAGHYTFMLRARNGDGVYSRPFNYAFSIRPPWWETWWAKSVYLLLMVVIIVLVIYLRTRRLTQQTKILETRVAERTLQLVERSEQLQIEKQKSDDLLLNILPAGIADELKLNGKVEAKEIDQVTILFGDFKDFTRIAQKMTHQELVAEIHDCYQHFDTIITQFGIEKIKTIGDSYMAAGGLAEPGKNAVKNTILSALEMQAYILARKARRSRQGLPAFEMRVGIHTGPVVAGVVGVKKFQYDIWGDTVNTASRMENTGEVGLVNVSQDTYRLVKHDPRFHFISRGNIEVKGKGKLPMYYVFPEGADRSWYPHRVENYVS